MTLTLTFGRLECYFKVDSSGGLTQCNKDPQKGNPYENLSEPAKKCCLQNWEQIQKEYNHSIKIFGQLLNWIPPQNECEIGTAFTLWIESVMNEKLVQLNLSNRKIKQLPPQIKLFRNLEVLDISDNLLLSLSPELEQLPLKEIDISGNVWMQSRLADCDWLKEKKECVVIANRMNLEHLPKGFSPFRVKCEIDFSLDAHPTSIREDNCF